MTRIDLEGGKYTVIYDNGRLSALRYGEPWRDLTGDGLVLALVHEIERRMESNTATLDFTLDAQRWGHALNSASWELMNSYRRNMGEPELVKFFNMGKTILRDAILKYGQEVRKQP
jgi:hypothetical protein